MLSKFSSRSPTLVKSQVGVKIRHAIKPPADPDLTYHNQILIGKVEKSLNNIQK